MISRRRSTRRVGRGGRRNSSAAHRRGRDLGDHRHALADPRHDETVVTRAFTGRPAQALRNGFIDRHQQTAPTEYPAVHHLTRALRQAAGQAGDTDRLHLWAGTGYRNAPTGPAADVIDHLAGPHCGQ